MFITFMFWKIQRNMDTIPVIYEVSSSKIDASLLMKDFEPHARAIQTKVTSEKETQVHHCQNPLE
jgi:cell fate (sporulation/competence/biofilm development) regulator YmcA (YheA/YmcA/DUF963 family)